MSGLRGYSIPPPITFWGHGEGFPSRSGWDGGGSHPILTGVFHRMSNNVSFLASPAISSIAVTVHFLVRLLFAVNCSYLIP